MAWTATISALRDLARPIAVVRAAAACSEPSIPTTIRPIRVDAMLDSIAVSLHRPGGKGKGRSYRRSRGPGPASGRAPAASRRDGGWRGRRRPPAPAVGAGVPVPAPTHVDGGWP